MRRRDNLKRQAIFDATVKLVNETGFAASSVSKIAREAGVSPATIYIYYKNKDDLLLSTYVEIKHKLSRTMLQGFDANQPIRDLLKTIWKSTFNFVSRYPAYFYFTEQFANSPYSDMVKSAEVEAYFEPILKVLRRGIEQKLIKDVPFDLLNAFIFYPIMIIANPRLCATIELNEATIDTAFELAWDAIKL